MELFRVITRCRLAIASAALLASACGDDAPGEEPTVFDPMNPLFANLATAPIPDADNIEFGTFRTKCGVSHVSYDDPIVFPGNPGESHLHLFVGNTDLDSSTTTRNIRSASASTCQGGPLNFTGYWIPALLRPNGSGGYTYLWPDDTYVLDENGTPMRDGAGKPIENENRGPDIYYKRGQAEGDVTPFPVGLRMISGRTSATPDDRQEFEGIGGGWSCHDVDSATHYDHIPPCQANPDPSVMNRLHLSIIFPQCWDGVHLDSPNHTSHMAFPYSPGNGHFYCPDTHPVFMPRVSYEFYWRITPQNVVNGTTSEWRMSSDHYTVDSTHAGGYSFHGDWMMAWNPEIMRTFTEYCINRGKHCSNGDLGNGYRLVGGVPGVGNNHNLPVINGGLGQ